MVTVVDVAVPTLAWFGLTLALAAIFRAELEMNLLVSALVSVSAASAGILVAVAAQLAVDVPVIWTLGGFAAIVLFTAALYEMAT